MDVLRSILAGIPPSQIISNTFACFPDASASELETIFCSFCLENAIISQEDLADLSLLQKKTQVPNKPGLATTSGKKKLLTFCARLLSNQSLLHIGYREVQDKEKLVTERHRYNLESVDGKIMQKEFVIASPQQQQVIASFTSSETKRHLVLDGPAGTGKTLVALQVTNSLIRTAKNNYQDVDTQPILVISGGRLAMKAESVIMKYLDSSTGKGVNKIFKSWRDLQKEFGVFQSDIDLTLLHLSEALVNEFEGRQIVFLLDEIANKNLLRKAEAMSFPGSVRMILVLNPKEHDGTPLQLPASFLHVTLTTSYRSTIAITSLARYIAKCMGLGFPEVDYGSDVVGPKPIFFDVGTNEQRIKYAFSYCHKHMGNNVTVLDSLVSSDLVDDQVKAAEGLWDWDCHNPQDFFGWEAEKVVTISSGHPDIMPEAITRAKTHLAVILMDDERINSYYVKAKKHFQMAADRGLVEQVQFREDVTEIDEIQL